MKRYIVFFLSLICIVITVGCNNASSIGNQLNNVSKIEIKSGSSGRSIEILDKEKIKTLIQPFADNKFEKGKSAKNHTGWSYLLKFYEDNKLVTEITVMNKSQISFNGYFYKTDNIDINQYEELLLSQTIDTASDEYQFEVDSDNTVTITKYTGKDEEVRISSEIDGKKVTAIGDNAFQGYTNLKTVTIPASVTVLMNCAFDACPNLQSVYFEGDAPQTGNYVFYPPLPTIYYHEGAAGWTNPWYSCPTETY